MATTPKLLLIPGSLVTTSGTYLVTHSSGHMSQAECVLPKGTLLPSCNHNGCHVTFTLVTPRISEGTDFKEKAA